jgi:6-phosphogluconate dehydrogenase (decarboxylating)
MALLHDRAVFHDAVNVSAVRKHAPAIQQFLIDSSKALVGEADQDLERICGWVIDNKKANWSAMLELEKQYPKWIM